ncbi:MAG: phosphonate ABC transporter ATP-binding protein [Pseudorhodoplanes sp.]|uniref:phosphonate ABC transporter ATP-binding protein n=1 Tax=Pseudorhodoplanes sp. TaxID=1934341 RepID=UPI003D10D019
MTLRRGIHVKDIHFGYGQTHVLRGFTLSVEPGEFVALVGPSGAGKTSLLRCIARLVEADKGEIYAAGHAMHVLSGASLRAARRDIAFVFQQFNLVRRRTAFANAVSGALFDMPLWRVVSGAYSQSDHKVALWALERVGLLRFASQRADRLSGGQQQRVAIARALVQRSQVILADEPVASLDPVASNGILQLLREIAREQGVSVLCSLHQPQFVTRFADKSVDLPLKRNR